jgi:tRNA (adenine57-N1/adenine58-N1)-methyltransferase
MVNHDDLIGKPWGSQVSSHQAARFSAQPSLADLLRDTPRNTQILYPKEIGYALLRLGIGPGVHVLEAGTGSGALTTALAFSVGKEGRVTSYEARPEMQCWQSKPDPPGLVDRVNFKLRNIEEGFDETGVDALFLDVPNPMTI